MSRKAYLLMVDDDEDDKSLFEELLKEIDPSIEFDSAENGLTALEKLREPGAFMPDLMIVDLNMPQLDGNELLDQLKRDNLLREIPVIIFTTSIRRQDIEKTLGMGAVCFATKPATVRDLSSFISAIGANMPGDPQNMLRMLGRLSFVTTNSMTIQNAGQADIPQLVELVNSAYRGTSNKGWTNEAHLIEGPRTDASTLARLLQDPGSVILKCVSPAGLRGCVHLLKQGDKLYLGLLSVGPAFQAAGIGKELLAAAARHARDLGCCFIRMTVISVRYELIAWYERHGFEKTGEVLPFHPDGKAGIQKQPLDLVVLERRVER